MSQIDKNKILRNLPGVDHILEIVKTDDRFAQIPRKVITASIRTALEDLRKDILADIEVEVSDSHIIHMMEKKCMEIIRPRLVKVINATGVVLHTNLGRALLCKDALENVKRVA